MKENSHVKILMVDDLAENLFALEVILSDEDYLCVRASSGKEALNILNREQDFCIILMDVQMPKMDGFETVEFIRQNEKLKQIPIIFLTASMDSSVQIFKGYLAGAVDYMIKPFSPAILKAKVAVFVDLYKKTHELLVQSEQMKMLNRNVAVEKLLSKYTLSLIEASHDPLFAISPDGKITDMNYASVKATGITRAKLIGSDFFDYFTEPKAACELYQLVFTKGFISDYPLTILDEKLTDVLFNGSVYKDDSGNVLGAVVVGRGITDQKKIENELFQEKNFAEQVLQKEEASTKFKDAFFSDILHEIQTPLNDILGFTDLLSKRKLGDEEKGYLRMIKGAGETLSTIINAKLNKSKIEEGKMIHK